MPAVVMAPTPELAPVGPLGVLIDQSLLALPAFQQPTNSAPGAAVPSYLLFGTLYSFVNAGDNIGLHVHADSTNHLTIVLQGSLTYLVQNSDGSLTPTTLGPGSFMFVPLNVTHDFVALTPGAACLNLAAGNFNSNSLTSQLVAANSALTALASTLTSLQSQVTALNALTGMTPTPVS
jgi:hypothetical protein